MDESTRLEELLARYPSLFVSLQKVDVDIVKQSLRKVIEKYEPDIKSKESRIQNAVSYGYFITGEKEKAYELNRHVLCQHPSNILALSNKAWFLIKDDDISQAEQVYRAIENTPNTDLELLVARGEIAYAYSRCSPKSANILAVQEYENIIEEYKKGRILVPERYFCLWTYGLFLALGFDRDKLLIDSELSNRRLLMLKEVTQIRTSDEMANLYQARSYTNIGKIRYHQIGKMKGRDRYNHLRKEPLHAFEMAYKLGYNDSYTMNMVGLFMRYYHDKLDIAVKVLKRSIELKETSSACVHLALAQKQVIERQVPKHQCAPRPEDRVVKMMKCPKHPITLLVQYKGHPQMDQILKNLHKAIEIPPTYMGSYYEMGLTYRQLDEQEKALENFEQITKFREHTSQRYIANAYAQSGFCMSDMLALGKGHYAGRNVVSNMINLAFTKCIEICCSLVRMVPTIGRQWICRPTLGQILQGTAVTDTEIIGLLFLYEHLKSHSNLEIIQKLRNITGHVNKSDKRIFDILNELESTAGYDDAILAIELITCLPNGFEALEDNICTEAYIHGALKAYKDGEYFLCRMRIANSLVFRGNKLQLRNGGNLFKMLDGRLRVQTEVMLIHQNGSTADPVNSLCQVFKEIGVNIKTCPVSEKLDLCADDTVVRYYIVFLDGNMSVAEDDKANPEGGLGNEVTSSFDTNVRLILEDLTEYKYGNLLVVKLQTDTDVPVQLRDCKTVVFSSEKNRQLDRLDDEDLDFIALALKKMTNVGLT